MGSIAQSSHTMRNIVLACCLGLALATGTDYAKQFAEFKQEFGKEYATAEEELERFNIFKAKAIEVHEHNKQNLPYTKGINFFSDLTEEEFKSTGATSLETRTRSSSTSVETGGLES